MISVPIDRADARDDARARRRHRLRALHRHPPPRLPRTTGIDVEESVGARRPRPPVAPSSSPAAPSSSRCSPCYFGGIPLVRALGYSAAIVVAVAVVAALTLLPAILGLLGERINALQLPFGRHPRRRPARTAGRAGRAASARDPWPAAIVRRSLILVALALPLLDITPRPARQRRSCPTDTADAPVLRHRSAKGFGAGHQRARCSSRSSSTRRRSRTRRSSNKVEASRSSSSSRQQAAGSSTSSRRRRAGRRGGRAGRRREPQPARADRQAAAGADAAEGSSSKSTASDPRLVKLEQPDRARTTDVDVGLAAGGQQATARAAVFNVTPTSAPVVRARRRTSSTDLRDDVIPDALRARGHDGLRRRLDRRLHRPRRPDRGEAPAGHRDRRRRSASCC